MSSPATARLWWQRTSQQHAAPSRPSSCATLLHDIAKNFMGIYKYKAMNDMPRMEKTINATPIFTLGNADILNKSHSLHP